MPTLRGVFIIDKFCIICIYRIVNQSIGPRNAFEEQIEWTENGKMWPYPIDNEYMLGEESEVSDDDDIIRIY